jgi:16S rRNA (uracil1498-N3)-methyltransferase
MELFYANPQNVSSESLLLDDFEAKHLLKTLRKKIGDSVDVTDGEGRYFKGRITAVKPKCEIAIESSSIMKQEERHIALGISFIRPNRLEFVLEKCTELGVNSFYLFRSTHANYFSNNHERFEKILRQAIKQSNRFFLPDLYLLPGFDSFIAKTSEISCKIAAVDSQSPSITSITAQASDDVLFCVGPEGGFSEKEISQLKKYKFHDISLGAYRLRAETAAIAGISKLLI